MAIHRQNASPYVCGIGMASFETMTVGLALVAEALRREGRQRLQPVTNPQTCQFGLVA